MLATKTSKLILFVLTLGLFGTVALWLCAPTLGGDKATPAKAGQDDSPALKEDPDQKPAGSHGRRSCIILWMSGGPSQMDTFDLKPGSDNGGPFQEIDTRVKGIRISEHLSLLATQADRLAILRSVTHKNGDHGGATYLMRTGRTVGGERDYPCLGSLLAKELSQGRAAVPPYVSIAPFTLVAPTAYGSSFLGPEFDPLSVARGIDPAVRGGALERALAAPPLTAFAEINKDRAEAMRKGVLQAFDLSAEKADVRNLYGRNLFGQGCLLARRLVEAGVPVVEVTLTGWDTHANNFDAVKALCAKLDPAWTFLLKDLADRKLLDSTLVLWMGEFGRTPRINAAGGRDHWPRCSTVVLAGAGIRGGLVIGRTSADGTEVLERPVTPPELLATVLQALGIDPTKENRPEGGEPVPLVEKGAGPIKEALK
jgi:hypothetical protein